MLYWFARRLKEVKEKDRKGEKGFTLIELLVVVIIIGILAAIAIPTFLNQRQNAWDAQTKSSIRNAVTNAESYATNNNGVYTGLAEADVDRGIAQVPVNTTVANVGAAEFCIQGANANGGTWNYLKSRDTIVSGAC